MEKTKKITKKKKTAPQKKKQSKLFLGGLGYTQLLVIILILFSAVCLAWIATGGLFDTQSKIKIQKGVKEIQKENIAPNLKSFASEDEFIAYLEQGDEFRNNMYYGGINTPRAMADDMVLETDSAMGMGEKMMDESGANYAQRVSETNVQVAGIDEPDIVKTDGQNIFYAGQQYYYYARPMMDIDIANDAMIMPPQYDETRVNIINAWPIDDLRLAGIIPEKGGELLLQDNILIVFYGQDISAYNISDPSQPTEIWNIELEDNTSIVTSRLYNKEIYLVTRNYINRSLPCPITPIVNGPEIRCVDIHHPSNILPVDTTYVAMKIDVSSGDIKNTTSLVGMDYSSVVYMSTDSLYITYNHSIDMFEFFFDFISNDATDIVPSDILAKIKKLKSYELNSNTKMMEWQIIMDEWQQSLSNSERLLVENELQNRMTAYFEKNKRSLLKTEIVKINLDKLKIDDNGLVPGYPLNQFSLDEYKGNLRIATTISNNFSFDQSANDVYVLDNNLKIIGSVQDLGLGERIYSARFIGDKAYLVTFRQVDPFYVLDLSDPKNPELKGQLKIPGYSSYLHPISENQILGIGEENFEVKISLFDVSDPANPTEIDKYQLDEYDSEVLRNHRAFLLDKEHQVFFLPGGKGGYIFSYANNNLKLVKAIAINNVKRAIYLNNYMYIIGSEEIVIVNENDWQEVNQLDLEKAYKDLIQ